MQATATLPRELPALPLWLVAAAGVALTALVGNRWNVAVLAWVASVPWLLYLRRTDGWRSRLPLLGWLQLGTFLNILKIVTAPLPWFFALMFSVPMALGAWLGLWSFEALRRRLGDAWGLLLFPAMAVALEWLSTNTSEMGSWGALAYSQLDNPALMQTASLFGLGGITALLAASSALVAVLLDSSERSRFAPAALALLSLVVAAHAFGAWRLDRPIPGPRVAVATVATDLHPSPRGWETGEALERGLDELFARTEQAIEQGAQLVVWNEGAAAVDRQGEAVLVQRGLALAREHGVDLVLGYVVPLGEATYENKYRWLSPDGELEQYWKHHPVPGEGAIAGTDPLVVHERPYGRAAGAICYDYDFPALGAEHADLDAGVVVVPSSDWRGIDPFHTQMAAVRGIEGGYSVVRSVRWATSGAFDAHGRARGLASYWEGDRVMVASVPATRLPTLYSRVGDVLPASAGLVLLVGLFSLGRRSRAAA